MTDNSSSGPAKAKWHPTKSFWITASIWLLLLIITLPFGGFGGWLVTFALFLILTALYALVFGRRSWLGLPNRKGAGAAVGAGVVALVVGSVAAVPSGPAPSFIAPPAETQVVATAFATSSPGLTPTPASILLTECFSGGESSLEQGGTLVCTLDEKGVLVWMLEKDSKALGDARAEATKAAAEKVAADKAKAVKAKADKAEAAKVAAAKAAAQKAAADEAARVAAEQAAKQHAPAPQPTAEVPADVYYPNCAAARAAGVDPINQGQPGYRAGLDGDKDGIACEPKR